MTSMVDVVFLLIIFFMLVSTYISAENVELVLPQPDHSLAEVRELPERIVLSCQYVSGESGTSQVRYLLGPVVVTGLQDLKQRLKAVAEVRPDVEVVVRADHRVRYQLIREAMGAIASAGLENMNIAAEVEGQQGGGDR